MENINLYGNNFRNPSENILRQAEESIAKEELFEARVLLNTLVENDIYLTEAHNNLAVVHVINFKYKYMINHLVSNINFRNCNQQATTGNLDFVI